MSSSSMAALRRRTYIHCSGVGAHSISVGWSLDSYDRQPKYVRTLYMVVVTEPSELAGHLATGVYFRFRHLLGVNA
jgi:hypothetical protein